MSLLPVALLGLLAVSYVTRPANRRGSAKSMLARRERPARPELVARTRIERHAGRRA